MEIKLINLIKKGAEAEIWYGKWLNLEAIFKIRKRKAWRHNLIDEKVREYRTLKESKIIFECIKNGINVPFIYDVDLENYTIVLEFVKGETLKKIFEKNDPKIFYFCEEIGKTLGKMHNLSIIHGDVTLTNIILRPNNELCFIDFGLAEFSNRIEDKGVDLHLFLRALESSFSNVAKECFESLKNGYKKFEKNSQKVFEKVVEIRKRGRYISERRKAKIY